MGNQKKTYTIYYFASYFFIYSFIGWLLETIFVSLNTGHFVNRGFLFGPLCPVYGFGVIIVIYLLNDCKNNILLFFLSSTLLVSSIEYFTGIIMLYIFNSRWWDYSYAKYNSNGFICLGTSILWGLLSIIVIHVLHPLVEIIIFNIPLKIRMKIIYFSIVIFCSDIIFSVIFEL